MSVNLFFFFLLQVAVYGGLIDRVHDLLLCGVDPSLVDLSICLSHPLSEEDNMYLHQETEALIRAASRPWKPSYHAFLYGPEFRACIASLCLVKVMRILHLVMYMLEYYFLFTQHNIIVHLFRRNHHCFSLLFFPFSSRPI